MCKYSVIIPVYQVKEYIRQCLDSILCQIPQDVQVILVDDGSTDGSGAICDEYARRHAQIEVIHQQNRGVAAARNAGLDAARGEYLLWVDPDDWVTPEWYSTIDRTIQREKPDIFVFDYIENENGKNSEKHYGRAAGQIDRELFLHDVTRDIRINSSLWNKVIRKALFENLRFDEQLACLEDYALLHLLIMKAERIVYLPSVLYFYRIRPSGLVRTLNLDVSYQSYEAALRRKSDIEATGRECDKMGCILQARGFCRNYYLAGMPQTMKEQFSTCQQMIQKNGRAILSEKELSKIHRVKLLFISVPVLGKVYFQKREQ